MGISEPEARVIAALAELPDVRAVTYDEIAAALDVAYDAVARVTPGLINAGFVKRFGGGKPFRHQITAAGRKLIAQPVYREIRQQVSSKAKQ
jgi:DNA-binding MarR family transcriptional regulator